MFWARLIYQSRNRKTPLKWEHRLARSTGLSQPSGCEGARPLRRAHSWARWPARTYAATTPGAGLGTPASVHIRDPRAGRPRGLASTHGHPGTYYMGRHGGRRGSCGALGPPANGQRATAIEDHGPLTEAGWTRCGWGFLCGSVWGCERAGSTPALPRSQPKSVRARWWASGASRSRDNGTPTGRGRAPCRGLGTGSGGTCWRCGNF